MERMLRVEISFVTKALDGSWRGVKLAEPGEEILGRGGRRIDIGTEPELAAGLRWIVAILALVGGICFVLSLSMPNLRHRRPP